MTAEGTRDTWVLHQGRSTVDALGGWLEGGVESTGVLNAIPQVGHARLFTVYQTYGGVMPVKSVARKSCHDLWPLTTPWTASPAEAGRGMAARRMEAMQCPSIEGNS